MDKKNPYLVLVMIIFFFLALASFFFLTRMSEKPCLPVASKGSVVVAEGLSDVAKDVPVKNDRSSKSGKAVRVIKMSEQVISTGNQGYFVRDGVYVYFGYIVTIQEEIIES